MSFLELRAKVRKEYVRHPLILALHLLILLDSQFSAPSSKALKKSTCRGDDLGGAPRAGQYAGWRPRSLHGISMRRPAPPEGPAAPAAGWRLHRGELELGDEDKASQWPSGQNQVGPDRSDRGQGRGDARHDRPQPMRDRRPFPTTGFEAKVKDMPSRCRPRGKALYKVPLPEQGRKITPRTPPPRSRQPAESSSNL
jgi:hypothetical protein